MDYVRVCLGVLPILLALCHPAHGECHCRVESQCDLHQTTCESGCEAGFTGSRCQYENKLFRKTKYLNRQKLVDGNIMTCPSYNGWIYASNIRTAGSVNTLRIRYAAGSQCKCRRPRQCEEFLCRDGCDSGYTGPLCKYKYPLFAKIKLKKGNKPLTATEDKSEPGLLLYTFEPNNVTDITLPLYGKVCEVELSYEDESDPVETATSMAAFQSSASITTPAKTRGKTGCTEGTYGRGCTGVCSTGCKQGSCHLITGDCNSECKDGWRGPRCEEQCPDGLYGVNCFSTCSPGCSVFPCDRKTGKCKTDRGYYCKPGWASGSSYPNRCDNCEGGYYMDRARGDCVECGAGCESGTCNANTGTCSCMSGWKGLRCATRCTEGTYGRGCTGVCSTGCKQGSCHLITGDCNSECKDGWRGPRCEERCIEGTYGRGCTGVCSMGCKQGSCHLITGDCNSECKDGWRGPRCEERCIEGTYGRGCTGVCSMGCKQGSCHLITGDCNSECKDGWRGPRCEERCIEGTYGRGCTGVCSMGCKQGSCHLITGDCNSECKDGWRGPRCEEQCPDGLYGVNCFSTCSPGCSVFPCDRKTGKCKTDRGYYCKPGWASGSSYPNRCDNCEGGYYMDRARGDCVECGAGCESGTCNANTGTCSCMSGWKGLRCTTRCIEGTYGRGCTGVCSTGCKQGSCHQITGDCNSECKDGWRGPRCEERCTEGTYGRGCTGVCSTGCKQGSCHQITGDCNSECKDGWRGPRCEEQCPDGLYGVNCFSTCSPGCSVFPCDRKTGKCKTDRGYYCKPGWASGSSYPNRCDNCEGGYYMDRARGDCVECGAGCESGTCNANTGTCSCMSGWKGLRCATRCTEGTYGRGCTGVCSTGCKQGSCHLITGDCNSECKDGWRGPRCEERCIEGTYGRGCTGVCSTGCKQGSCHHITGDCKRECKDGWRGPRCEEQCPDGSYGDNCVSTCSPGCRVFPCDKKTGKCKYDGGYYCIRGWTSGSSYPNRCDSCSVGYYQNVQDCTQCGAGCNGGCDGTNGHCTCKTGWTGTRCNNCEDGYYMDRGDCVECGAGCEWGTCNANTGTCSCVSGWKGPRCATRCRPGTYGQDCRYQCNEGCQPEKCDSIDGRCRTSCRSGWTGENCVDICSPGTYGENCVLNCSRGCVNQTCDRTTGRCDMCLDGWEHKDQNASRCDKECDDGRYGEQCNDECSIHCVNATCHHVNGSCTHGCFDGRSGKYCEVSEAEHQNVNLIAGLLLFLIAVIAVVMCAVVYFREPLRRLRGKKTGEDMTNGLSFPMAAREGQGASGNGAVYDDDEAIYINVPRSVPVAVSDLKDFVAKKKATKEILVKEYAELPKGLTAIHDKALTQVNSPKNRFKGIYPYNHSLVVLKGPSGSTGYINASFIDGPTRGKQYIATQGPLPHTVVDFWEMIWQQNVPVIVMLANIIEDGRRRCEPYWPNEPGEDSKTFGPWKITVADSCPLADFTIRTLKMRKGAAEKTVKHIHYMVWPDKDVPDNTMSLVDLRNKVRTFCDFAEGPMVVHCSAGVGRTGTLMALDSLIEDAETRSKVDIYGCVWRLRNFRVSMVQTQSQYVFLHDCILDALCHTVHPTPASFYDNAYKQLKRDSGIAVAYQKLSECPVTDHLSDAARDLENINKNRSEDILPGDKHRAILSTHIAGGTDYINAVIAPSYEKREAFILTQIPLTSTVVDFWRLVHDYDIRGIVLLENYTDLDAKCGVFWAKDNKPAKFGPFSVGEGKPEKQTGFTMEKISYSLGTEEKDVTLFRSSAWPQKSSLPESPSSLLSLIDFLRQWNTGTSPLLVVCSDGATRSGLFCVVASAVQRLLLEKEVALQQTIRSIRFVRKQVIPNREQFEFCFDSVKVYMDRFQEYSNFA